MSDNKVMISRIKRLPVSVIIGIVLILLCVVQFEWSKSEISSRVGHHCYNPSTPTQECYISYYRNISEKSGTKASLLELHKRLESDSRFNANCHSAMHAIGRSAFREYGSIAEAYAQADYSCWGGYLHGVVEASMSRKKLSDISAETVRTMCDSVKTMGETSFMHFSCVHGMGHALMYVGHNDLPNTLLRCDDLADEWESRQCANGAFMENTIADSDHPTLFQPKDDLKYPCSVVREKDRDVCYQVQSKFILDHFKWDFPKAFDFCNKLETKAYRTLCAQGLGAGVSVYTAYDPKVIYDTCSGAGGELSDECLYGALTDLEGKTGTINSGTEVCQYAPVTKRSNCINIVKSAHVAFPGATKNSEGWRL